jgi:hypothetical protein
MEDMKTDKFEKIETNINLPIYLKKDSKKDLKLQKKIKIVKFLIAFPSF